ncbi:MAG: YciI family protein [Bacteroidota bacterium]
MKKLFLLFCFISLTFQVNAQEKNQIEKKYEMKTYYLVFLKKGPNRNQDSATVSEIQKQHIAHLDKMDADGKLCMAGPLMEDGDIRGICVYYTATKEEAEKLAKEDPAVKAGRLTVEIHPWYAAKGSVLK